MGDGKLHLSGWFDDFDGKQQCDENDPAAWEWYNQVKREEQEALSEWEELCTDYGGEG